MQIDKFLRLSVASKASDLHILPGLSPLIRVNGDLHRLPNINPLTEASIKRIIYGLMSKEEQAKFEKNMVIDMAVFIPGLGNFRMSAFHQLQGISAVFRVISNQIPSFDAIGLPSVLKRLLMLSQGLILVTGPTGSGKSTTLASMIESINKTRAKHIITIEDPIEYIYESKMSAINQIQVGRDTPSVSAALRSALRQDPNVILLGELRDLETIRLALIAAETGHLVLATLHASSAPLAISRVIDMFPNAEKNRIRNLVSETIQAIVCQTLLKKLEGGRVAAFEILLANAAVKHLIRQDKIAHMSMTMQTNGDIGMCTFDQYLDKLVANRLISTEVARSATLHRTLF